RPSFERILALSDEIDDPALLATAASFLGFAAGADLDGGTELRYGLTALRFAALSDQTSLLFNANGAVAEGYGILGYSDLAIQYYSRSLESGLLQGNPDSAAQAAYEIAGFLRDSGRPEQARKT